MKNYTVVAETGDGIQYKGDVRDLPPLETVGVSDRGIKDWCSTLHGKTRQFAQGTNTPQRDNKVGSAQQLV